MSILRVERGVTEIAFTSYSALKTAILDDMASGKILTSGYSIGGRSISFRSMREVLDYIQWLDMMISAEGGGLTSFVKFERPGNTDEDDT